MSWHDKCHDFDSRVEASADDDNFHDVTFLLLHEDAENPSGDKIGANKHLLALVSPVFYAQFYGPLAVEVKMPIEIVDGTAYGFKKMMDFINHPKSFKVTMRGMEDGFEIVNFVDDMFEIVYFAHKYQIGALVSYCRQFLGSFGSRPGDGGFYTYFEKEEALDILQWARQNSHLENRFMAEYHLLVQACWETIGGHFKKIFPDGNISNDRPLPEEELMLDILGNKSLFANESFVFSVTLNYFIQLIDELMLASNDDASDQNKKIKIDKIHLWNQKLEKITKVIDLKRVSPSEISNILDQVEDKMPAPVIDNIMAKFTAGETSKTSFQEKNRADLYNAFIEFDVCKDYHENEGDGEKNEDGDDTSSDNSSDFGDLHTVKVDGEYTIKFTINKNAVFSAEFFSWGDTNVEAITFQNSTDYEEIVKEDWKAGQDGVKFFAKENTLLTLSYKVLKHRKDLTMYEVKNSHWTSRNFRLDILEVNGKPVSSDNPMCYSVLKYFRFHPV